MRRIATMAAPRCGKLRRRWTLLLAAAALAALGGEAAHARQAPQDPPAREQDARQAFMVGDYPTALELYRRLYTESHHPTYLRNIGRCHQMMREPDRAISVFREYLRIAPDLPAIARAEVEGYIRDMQALQARNRQEAERGRAPVPPARADAPVTPAPPPPPRRRWLWLTAGGGALVAAAATTLLLLRGRGPGVSCGPPECSLSQIRVETR